MGEAGHISKCVLAIQYIELFETTFIFKMSFINYYLYDLMAFTAQRLSEYRV